MRKRERERERERDREKERERREIEKSIVNEIHGLRNNLSKNIQNCFKRQYSFNNKHYNRKKTI